MSRTTKIMGFSVPPIVVKEVETLAKQERRTKSELFREMVRVYRRYRDQRDRDENRWIMGIIEEAKSEQVRNPMSTEDMLKESDRLAEDPTDDRIPECALAGRADLMVSGQR